MQVHGPDGTEAEREGDGVQGLCGSKDRVCRSPRPSSAFKGKIVELPNLPPHACFSLIKAVPVELFSQSPIRRCEEVQRQLRAPAHYLHRPDPVLFVGVG